MGEMSSAVIGGVSVGKGFFRSKMDDMRNTVIPYQWKVFCDEVDVVPASHCVRNFRITAGDIEGSFYGAPYQDSDVAKWLEAAAYCLEDHPDADLEKKADDIIELLARMQEPDGYLNSYYSIGRLNERLTNLQDNHELYIAGHMMEAAVAYYRATGKRKLLDIMLKMARCIDNCIGPEEHKIHGYPGHPEVELALMRMYEVTGETFLFDLARYFIDTRGTSPSFFDWEQETFH